MNAWSERLFLLLVFSLGFMQPSLKLAGMSLPPTDFVFVAVSLVFALAVLFKRRRITFDRSYLYFGSFCLAMLLSAGASERPWASFVKLVGVVYLVGLAVISINVVDSTRSFKRVVLAWLAGSLVACLIGVVTVVLYYVDRSSPWHELFLHHYGSLPEGNYPRIQSTFIYPAMLCNYLTVGALLTLGAWKSNWIRGPVCALIVGLHVLAAVFTVTPGLGGMIFGLAAFGGWILLGDGQSRSGRVAILGGTMAAAAFTIVSAISIWPIATSPYTFEIFGYRFDPTQRLLAWQGAVQTFATDPFLGKGIGLAATAVLFQTPSGQMQVLTDAHNTFLSVAAQSGIIGLAAVCMLIAHLLTRKFQRSESNGETGWYSRSLLIAFVSCFLVQGLVGSFEDARHLWVLMGLMVAADRIAKTESLA